MNDVKIDEKHMIKEIAGRIREVRERMALPRLRMAEILGVSYSSVGKYVNGTQMLTVPVLLRLSAYLGISLDWLLTGRGGMMRDEQEEQKRRMEPLVEQLLGDKDLCALLEKLLRDSWLRYEVLHYFYNARNAD